MLLTDDEGNVLAQIDQPHDLRITEAELKARRDHEGETYTTAEVQVHLESQFGTPLVPREDFQVEWLPQALNDLVAILGNGNTQGRHRSALMGFHREAVNSIDPELRAWATLSRVWGDEGYVLIIKTKTRDKPLAVLFRVFPKRFVVLVEHIQNG